MKIDQLTAKFKTWQLYMQLLEYIRQGKNRIRRVASCRWALRTFFESVERTQQHSGYAVLPYIKGLTEPLKRTLEKHDIKVFSKPVTTLFPSLKHRPTMEEQMNIIYKIPCKDYSWSYIGETGRSLKTRKSEHLRNVEHCKKGSNMVLCLVNRHSIF